MVSCVDFPTETNPVNYRSSSYWESSIGTPGIIPITPQVSSRLPGGPGLYALRSAARFSEEFSVFPYRKYGNMVDILDGCKILHLLGNY